MIKSIKTTDAGQFIKDFENNPVEDKPVFKHLDIVSGKVTVRDGKVYYNDQLQCDGIAATINNLIAEGLPFTGMLKFLERLYNSTSWRVREQLPKWIGFDGLVVTEDGYLLAYKAVRADWWDKWTGKTHRNILGSVQSMDRGKVCDDPQNACAPGLHAGSLVFVAGYGCGDDHIIIVKIDPSDIVCIPYDSSDQKMRVCKYEVIAEYSGKLKNTLYTGKDKTVPAEIIDPKWEEVDEDDDDGYYGLDDDDSDIDFGEEDEEEESGYEVENLGVKPDGSRYHNVRDESGKFRKK